MQVAQETLVIYTRADLRGCVSQGRVEGYGGPIVSPETEAGYLDCVLILEPQDVVGRQAAQHYLLAVQFGQGFAGHVENHPLLVSIWGPAVYARFGGIL